MSRVIVVVAVIAAILIVLGDRIGAHLSIDGIPTGQVWGWNGHHFNAAAAGRPTHVGPQTFAAETLIVRNATAALYVTPEDRKDITVEISNPGSYPDARVGIEAGKVVIDGQLDWRVRGCHELGDPDDALVIKVHTPKDVRVETRGAVVTHVGPSANASLSLAGCSAAEIADTAGALELTAAGKGDVKAGAARTARVEAAGLGDVVLGDVKQELKATIAGAGSVKASKLQGVLDASIAGSGDIEVADGALDRVSASIAGAGRVAIAAPVQELRVSIMGSGNMDVTKPVHDVDATIMGSGDVSVLQVTGAVRKSVMGSGRISVGGS